jgi:hypothetical protein
MYALQTRNVEMPAVDRPYGFDLIAKSWVKPHGSGLVSDIMIAVDRLNNEQGKVTGMVLHIDFPNPGDGVIQIQEGQVYPESDLKLPREAPFEGYSNSLVRWEHWGTGTGYVRNRRDDLGYFMRIRTVLIETSVVSALYGKINGDFHAHVQRTKTAQLDFRYYVNPEPNSRNVEFDTSRNLFQNLEMLESVRYP